MAVTKQVPREDWAAYADPRDVTGVRGNEARAPPPATGRRHIKLVGDRGYGGMMRFLQPDGHGWPSLMPSSQSSSSGWTMPSPQYAPRVQSELQRP
jgi:hypothetical protein